MNDRTGADDAAAAALLQKKHEEEHVALKDQLAGLEAQREQLASLLGGDPQGPLLQLQAELGVTIAGIHQRLRQGQATTTSSLADDPDTDSGQGSIAPGLFAAGDVCLAPRVFDRRRARAVVEAVDDSKGTSLVTWVHPRQRGELACRYWKEGRNCKHSGPDCPFSHGIEVPLADLLPFNHDGANLAGDGSTLEKNRGEVEGRKGVGRGVKSCPESTDFGDDNWLSSLSSGRGHRVLAKYHDRVWYEATVEGAAGEGSLNVRFKGFEDDGSVSLPADHFHLAPVEETADGAAVSSRGGGGGSGGGALGESPASDGEESEIEDAWADATPTNKGADGETGSFFQERVLGERGRGGGGAGPNIWARSAAAAAAGPSFSDAYVVGDWEQHTKGFGSRMMSRMGYRRGEGLGKEKQGIARPVPIRVLPERRALDHLRVDDGPGARASSGNHKLKSKPRGFSSASSSNGEPQKAMFDFLNVTIHASVKGKATAGGGPLPASGLVARDTHRAGRRPVFDAGSSSCISSSVSSLSTSGGAGGSMVGSGEGAGAGRAKAGVSGRRAGDMSRSELRSHVVEAREAEVSLATKVERLKETIKRNSERDPRVAAQAKQKLEEVQAQAREIRASRDRAERVLGNKGGKGKGDKGKSGLFSF